MKIYFAYMENILYLCSVKLQIIYRITKFILAKMKDFLKKISAADYPSFREQVIKRCFFSVQQYCDRRSGRVQLSELERNTIQQIVDEFNGNDHGTVC